MTRTKSSRFIAMLLAVVMVFSAMPMTALTAYGATTSGNTTEFAGGSGTEEDPYLISTKEHLDNIRDYPTSHFKMIGDIEFTDADFERGGDFYNGGREWLPIAEFRGTFDGNEKTISNLRGPGIFGDVYNGAINNLHIRNHSVGSILFISNIYSWNNGCCAGGIASAIKGTTIENCTGDGITIEASKDGPIGGLIGVSYSSTIENSEFETNCNNVATEDNDIGLVCAFAEATIVNKCKSYGTMIKRGEGNLGGIVGLARTCLINECENYAMLQATGVFNDGCGGIVGYFTYGGSLADSGILNCKNWGSIKCTGTSADAGGILGVLYDGLDQLTLCANEGAVEGGETAGGIVGLCNSNNTAKIDKCTNNGRVNGRKAGGITGYLVEGTIKSMHNAGEVFATYVCGGIAGESYGSVSKCSNIGKVNLSSGSSTTYLGGIVGANGDVVSECYNAGKITANCYDARVGGIAGVNLSGDNISNSYNIGDIICDYSNSKKIYTIGGICGENKQPMDAIVNCYNIGAVPEMDDDIGLICGYNPEPGEAFKNCYIVEGVLMADVGFGYGDGSSTQLSKQQMQTADNFSGFDFDSVWTMAGNEDYLYPELKSVEMIYVPFMPGDVDNNGEVDMDDAIYLLFYTNFPEDYPINQPCDYDNNGEVDMDDAIYLLFYTNFPEDYPLN